MNASYFLSQKNRHKVSESLLIGSLLAITGGFLDIYTYITRGKVFANAQTGNIVLLGLGIAKGDFQSSLHYSYPILAFIVGIFLAEVVKKHCGKNAAFSFHWLQVILFIEIAVIFLVSLVPEGRWDNWVNVAISFVCSMQVQSFRQLKGNAYATTMCTGNLRSATDFLFQYIQDKNPAKRQISIHYYLINVFFVLGVIVGAYLTWLLGGYAGFVCCLILLLVFGILFWEERDSEIP